MKGRQLTLEEVLRLEDGTKVWVEDSDEGYEQVGTIVEEDDMLKLDDGRWFYLSELPFANFVAFYEWIEELFIPDKIETLYYSYNVIKDMATEICNLRGIDLTEDNIDKIIKEFVDKK